MQAIILAAGMGKRLKELTAGNTKCMVKVNGITLAERALRILDKKNLSRIVIVVGYEGQKLIDYIATLGLNTEVVYIDNPIYDKTNNIYSLSLAKDYLEAEDTLLLESDLIFEEALIDMLLEDDRPTLALVDKYKSWMDGTCMVIDEEDRITDFIPGKSLKYEEKEKYYKTVNIYKLSSHFSMYTYVPFLEAYSKAMGNNEYYESVIKLIAMLDTHEIRAKRLNGEVWYEIDDIQDLDIAQTLFPISIEDKYDAMASRYGGYWRYPSLIDYCYLVNPYYPPQRMLDEIKSNFETLITEYPSGMRVNSLLAAKYFGVPSDNILIGNGAAELIHALMDTIEGVTGFIRPTFEEYPNRFDDNNSVIMTVKAPDFTYRADDIIGYFGTKKVDNIVLINPDNPTGNYLEYEDVLRLVRWCEDKNIRLIYDESFSDFAKNDVNSIIDADILGRYKKLVVIKSISKSHGVPGIRLGVLASGDEKLIAKLKKDVSIWNINSYGEFYMQIAEKYKKDYAAGISKLIEQREKLSASLADISYLRVLPSQANYVMAQVTKGTARQLACYLLERDIFIKDLTSKIGDGCEYIRLAVRDEADNAKLINALNEYA